MPGIVQRSDFPIFMTPAGTAMLKNKMWDTTKNLRAEQRDDYYNTDTTDDPFYMSHGMVGIGNVQRKHETVPTRFDAPRMGRPFAMVFPTYALAVAISREAQEDDKDNALVPLITRELKRAMIEAQEQDAADQFNDAFVYQGWESDGVALASTNHPLLRSAYRDGVLTGSNRHPTDAALTIASLDAAFTALKTTRDDTGRWLKNMDPVYLDVAPALYPYAMQIVGTARVLGSNNNDKNLYYGALTPRANPRFIYPNAWSLDCGKDNNSWIWRTRRKPDLDTKIDIIADVTILKTSARWGRGAEDWRGKYFSKGPA